MFNKTSPKFLLVAALFTVSAIVLTACGSAPAEQPQESVSAQSDASETGASVSESDVVEVQVTLTEFAFEASQTTFEVGVPYRFTVTNSGMLPHEMMIIPKLDESITGISADGGDPGAMMDNDNEGELMEIIDGYALVVVEEDDLGAGATATFDYTFTEPAELGQLEFACYVPGHYEAGMSLPITVK
ncbi:MAG: hypothetical protein L3J16_06120 [Anaerolineales bacterium]|nr:hypothetical protein [Anaerolineales bacterium]